MTDKPLDVIAGSPDKPLVIGDIEIQCYVLQNEERVLTQRGMIAGIGLKSGGGSSGTATKAPRFFTSKAIEPFIPNDLKQQLKNPILFNHPSNGALCFGYPAKILPDICNLIIDANEASALFENQKYVPEQCKLLIRGLAGLAMVALVDEVTGYQNIRESDALKRILEKYLQDNARKWAKTFPDEFWQKLIKTKGYPNYYALKRPAFVGHWINDLVYARLAPGVLGKLKKINPKIEKGYRKNRHHQHLTENHGVPELKEHLIKLMALMDASISEKDFEKLVSRAFGEKNGQYVLFLETKAV